MSKKRLRANRCLIELDISRVGTYAVVMFVTYR